MALFGIKRIQYCKATQLAFSGQNNPFLGIASEPTNTFTDIVCLINSRATLTIEQAVVNKQIVYTAKLQFVTPADPMLDVDHYAFIATTNEGERILLGANTRPQVAVVTAQGVFGNAGELTAYTTTAEFKANYRPMRLPVTAAEPISGPAYDICCGQIPQPTAPDTRDFDICCGEIVGEQPAPTLLTVIWQNYDGTELDRKTYYAGQPEPTTTVVPTRRGDGTYGYSFDAWSVYAQTSISKIYRATFTAAELPEKPLHFYIYFTATGTSAETKTLFYSDVNGSTTQRALYQSQDVGQKDIFAGTNHYFDSPNYLKFPQSEAFTILTIDWGYLFDWYPNLTPIYDTNNTSLIIGYYSENWQGEI